MQKPAASHISMTNGQISEKMDTVQTIQEQDLIYEVFRIEQKHPLFLDDHLLRLNQSIRQTGHVPGIKNSLLKKDLLQMIRQSRTDKGNIRIEFCFEKRVPEPHYFRAFFIPTSYPDNSMYKNGVACNLLEATRTNPSVKMANPDLRNRSDQIIKKEHIYETILVNQQGTITEGSRSNLFFIRDNTVYTAPDHLVLKGIMRQKVLQVLETHHIEVKMEAIPTYDLPYFEGCFITGTSPRVLPVQRIDSIHFTIPNPLISNIKLWIDDLIAEHIAH